MDNSSKTKHSDELRLYLDTDQAHRLDDDDFGPRKKSKPTKKRKHRECDSDLGDDEPLGPIPEAEDDGDYLPVPDKKIKSRANPKSRQQKKKDGRGPVASDKASNAARTARPNGATTSNAPSSQPPGETQPSRLNGSQRATGKSHTRQPTSNSTSEQLFSIQKHETLPPKLDQAKHAQYAWSAEEAEFASVSLRAQFAVTADRLTTKPVLGALPDEASSKEAYSQIEEKKKVFEKLEHEHRGKPAQLAETAEYAGCVDSAKYAVQATEACFALHVIGSTQTKDRGGPDGED